MAKKKILLVDYDRRSLTSLTELFGLHNMQTTTATDGVSGYEKFISEKPDLVILEAMLPKLHGFDLAQKIHQETKGSIPVIIMTGVYKGPQYRNEALRTFGASDYFEKPFDQEKLKNSVLRLLKEEVEVGEEIPDIRDLPSPASVVEDLTKRLEKLSHSSKEE